MKIVAKCQGCPARFAANVPPRDAVHARSMAQAFADSHTLGKSQPHRVTIREVSPKRKKRS